MKKFLCLISALLFSSALYGHVPYVQTRDRYSIKIPMPIEKSLAYYMDFEDDGDVDLLYFRLDNDDFEPGQTITDFEGNEFSLLATDENGVTGRRLHFGSLVPGCETYSDILPSIAIVGPLQEYLQPPDLAGDLPFDIDDDEGVYILENNAQGELWYEKFTFKSYYDQKKDEIILTEEGKYKIYIWEPDGNTGDYVFEVGFVEIFDIKEISRALFWEIHLVNDGEISCDQCKEELEDLDGPNPSLREIIEMFSVMFQ